MAEKYQLGTVLVAGVETAVFGIGGELFPLSVLAWIGAARLDRPAPRRLAPLEAPAGRGRRAALAVRRRASAVADAGTSAGSPRSSIPASSSASARTMPTTLTR